MDSITVLLARVVIYLDFMELDPRGKLHYPDFFRALVERYQFQKFPQKYEDFDVQKAPITLADGKWGDVHIAKVDIYAVGLVVDTRSSTDDAEKLIHDCLSWASEAFGVNYYRNMLKRKAYVSQLMFQSDAPIFSKLSPSLSELSERVNLAVETSIGEKLNYQPTGFAIHFDQFNRQLSPAAFSVSRRVGVPFSENRYFSEAPLPTSIHEELLRGFETELSN